MLLLLLLLLLVRLMLLVRRGAVDFHLLWIMSEEGLHPVCLAKSVSWRKRTNQLLRNRRTHRLSKLALKLLPSHIMVPWVAGNSSFAALVARAKLTDQGSPFP
jgi:hypothetical protein